MQLKDQNFQVIMRKIKAYWLYKKDKPFIKCLHRKDNLNHGFLPNNEPHL